MNKTIHSNSNQLIVFYKNYLNHALIFGDFQDNINMPIFEVNL